ncbi:nucleotide disphospho-sugar-binding domain-containing protein [Kitasatospora phosalacinea]|uniref:nucleotide disphospho-sugar-binding domain-containing protein n=1 Tax=Kitasatospora phosalacinea TaxID=2065 RepID=UPI00365AC68D
MSKIIVAATPITGHTGPLLRIAAHLAGQGHQVAFLGGSRYAAGARSRGLAFTALPAEADYDDRDFTAAFRKRERVPTGLARVLWDVMHLFGDPLPAQYRALRALLADFPATTVLHDSLFLGGVALAGALSPEQRPTVLAVGTTPLTLPSRDTAPPMLGLLPPTNDEERTRYAELRRQLAERLAPAFAHVNNRFAAAGVPIEPDSSPLSSTAFCDRYLQLTVPAFEFPRSDLPANVSFVGPLPIPADPGAAEPDWWPRLAEARSEGRRVVVVTQGTLANADLDALLTPTVRALAHREDLLVIAATARADAADLLPDPPANTVVTGFVPFDTLLPHADVLVTNGGYGGVQAALGHGVPVIAAGDTEDKPEVAARVQWTGTGINLRTGHPTQDALANAVDTVLADPGHRERAKALAEQYKEYDTLCLIAALTEESAPWTPPDCLKR